LKGERVFGKTVATVVEEKPRDFLAELHRASEALAKTDEALAVFRTAHYTTVNGVTTLTADRVGARDLLDRETFSLCRSRDAAMREFQSALVVWSQFKN
jgi:hypothetical protein